MPDGTDEKPIMGTSLSPYNEIVTGSESEEKYSVEIFPNPTNGLLNLKLNAQFSSNLIISLNNMMGVELKSYHIFNTAFALDAQVDISEIPSGTYYLKIESDTEKIVKKIIKF